MDFLEICNVCARKGIIKAAKRIINSDKMCRSYSDLNFGVTFLEHSVVMAAHAYVGLFIHERSLPMFFLFFEHRPWSGMKSPKFGLAFRLDPAFESHLFRNGATCLTAKTKI